MAKDTFLNRKLTLNCKGKLIDISSPSVMAILNLTPDSFYSNSRKQGIDDALKATEAFLAAGAKFIDIGAYSTRPGAATVSEDEELERLIESVAAIGAAFPEALISIDTFRAKVAKYAIEAGAHVINDIGGGDLDTEMFATVAALKVPYIMMHMKGTPQTMQDFANYTNIAKEVFAHFSSRVAQLTALGANDIILDPGFGFAKTLTQNYDLLKDMEVLNHLNLPLLVGFSRKSMVTKLLNITANEALNGTSVLNTAALLKGANILRVHDVKEATECITLINQLR